MRQSFLDMALRECNAKEEFARTLQQIAGVNEITAATLTNWYLRKKLAKLDRGIGRVTVIHGAFLDREAILHAVNLMCE